ncbi:hypothetical protein ACO1O0_008393 [Amphichorda felina]
MDHTGRRHSPRGGQLGEASCERSEGNFKNDSYDVNHEARSGDHVRVLNDVHNEDQKEDGSLDDTLGGYYKGYLGDYLDGYNSGYHNGYLGGHDEAYENGFDSGYADGFDSGHIDCFDKHANINPEDIDHLRQPQGPRFLAWNGITPHYSDGEYTNAEREWLWNTFGGEERFLWKIGLDLDNKRHRIEARAVLRAMIEDDKFENWMLWRYNGIQTPAWPPPISPPTIDGVPVILGSEVHVRVYSWYTPRGLKWTRIMIEDIGE